MGWIRAYVDLFPPTLLPKLSKWNCRAACCPHRHCSVLLFLLSLCYETLWEAPEVSCPCCSWHHTVWLAPAHGGSSQTRTCWGSGKPCTHSPELPSGLPLGLPSPPPRFKPSSFPVSHGSLLCLLEQQALFITLLPSIIWVRSLSYLCLETKVDSEVS